MAVSSFECGFLDAVFIVYGLKMSRSEVLSSFEERLI